MNDFTSHTDHHDAAAEFGTGPLFDQDELRGSARRGWMIAAVVTGAAAVVGLSALLVSGGSDAPASAATAAPAVSTVSTDAPADTNDTDTITADTDTNDTDTNDAPADSASTDTDSTDGADTAPEAPSAPTAESTTPAPAPTATSPAPTPVDDGREPGEPLDVIPTDACPAGWDSDMVIGRCDMGEGVEQVQNILNYVGYELDVDGIFGPATEAALVDFQATRGLQVTGTATDEFWDHVDTIVLHDEPSEWDDDRASAGMTVERGAAATEIVHVRPVPCPAGWDDDMVIGRCDMGEGVEQVQNLLNYVGYELEVTGAFDLATENALVDFQATRGLQVTGTATDEFWDHVDTVVLHDEPSEWGDDHTPDAPRAVTVQP